MRNYLRYILDLLIKEREKKEIEVDDRPCVQLEIQEENIIFPEKEQEEKEEKSSVIIIDI
jgi:hypothetical protein